MDLPFEPLRYTIAEHTYFCPVQLTVEILSGRWKPMIVWHLVQHPKLRYSEIKRSLISVTHKMLTQSLRELEADGLIVRRVHEVVPPQVDYSLSAQGEKLRDLFMAMREFGAVYQTRQSLRPDGHLSGLAGT